MVFGSFLYKESKNLVAFRSSFMKAATSILSSASSIESAFLLKRDMQDLSVLFSRYLMLIKQAVDFLYLCPLIKCTVN